MNIIRKNTKGQRIKSDFKTMIIEFCVTVSRHVALPEFRHSVTVGLNSSFDSCRIGFVAVELKNNIRLDIEKNTRNLYVILMTSRLIAHIKAS